MEIVRTVLKNAVDEICSDNRGMGPLDRDKNAHVLSLVAGVTLDAELLALLDEYEMRTGASRDRGREKATSG